MPGWIGLPELVVLLVVLLLIFGPKRLPEMGRSLGKGMREFKDSVSKHTSDINNDDDDESSQPSLPAATDQPVATAQSREHDTV